MNLQLVYGVDEEDGYNVEDISIASAAQHSSPCLGDRLPVARYCSSSEPAGLR